MSLPLVVGCFWVLAATATAMLPMRQQYRPGVTLLILAPLLILWIGAVHGWWWAVIGLLAFGSMFRNPLIYLYRRAKGERPQIPSEMRR